MKLSSLAATHAPHILAAVAIAAAPASAAARAKSTKTQKPSTTIKVKNPIIVKDSARFTIITPTLIRLEFSPNGEFVDAPTLFAVNRNARKNKFTVTNKSGATVIDTGRITLTYKPDGNPFSPENLSAFIKTSGAPAIWRPGMKNAGNLGGTIRTVDGVQGPVDLGEGVLSRDGWYLMDDSRGQLFTKDWIKSRPGGLGTDWYLFGYGSDYLSGLNSLAAISGRVPMPRKYALGAWYSRYWPYTSKEYRDIVAEYSENGFPLDVMVMDMDWHRDGWTGWSWNRKLLPDAEDLLKWFHEQGLSVTLNLHPADGVGPHEDAYEQFMRDMGEDPSSKKTITYDAGDKKYLDTIFEDVHAPLEAQGVDFWWLDWQQYQYTRSISDLTNLAWLNHYYYNWTSRNGLRGLSFSRWAGWGDHRNPIHFSGDSNTGWPMLAFEIPLTSIAGNIGAFYWSHDIGGHMGARIPESYTRWVQFGALSAALRSHSTRSAELDRRPWKYPKWARDSMRMSFHLRSELFPYIYSSAWQCYSKMMPLVRPMYLLHPADKRSYKNPQQYYFGDALLVAPIVTPGEGPGNVGKQSVWFPDGTWYNWFTGERFNGGDEIIAAADIDEFPLYAKGGIPIPMQKYTERMAAEPVTELIVRAWPGEDGKTGLYHFHEDDGITNDYKTGKFSTTKMSYTRNASAVTIQIGAAAGEYNGQPEQRSYIVELHGTKRAVKVKVDGKQIHSAYNPKTLTNTVIIPKRSIRKPVIVSFIASEAAQPAIIKAAAARRLNSILGNSATSINLRGAIFTAADKGADNKLIDMLLAAGGTSLGKKNEALYYYKGIPAAVFYARPGLADNDAYSYRVIERFGDTDSEIFLKEITAKKPLRFDVPKLPPMSPPTQFGVQAKRIATVDFTIGGMPFSLEEEIENRPSYLTKWNIAGIFDFKRDQSLESQKFAPESGAPDLSAVFSSIGGMKTKWRKAKPSNDDTIDLNAFFHLEQHDTLAYGLTFIDSDIAQPATFKISSDDGIVVWLNGKQIFSRDGGNGASWMDTASANAELTAGRNTLLVKVSQYYGDWKFRLSLDTRKQVADTYGSK